ncbi:MAG TPA: hypothetical protein VH374_08640 [Polyangia bacterium]|nr:hypothetical protein [Polyangia bacterium]
MALAALSAARLASAQAPMGAPGGGGMPSMRAISGKPLPDRGMPAGTVTVRVGRKTPANAVANLDVTAIIKNAGGDLRKRTAKTDSSGRAIFEGIAADQQFQAEVIVDGERLQTDAFPMPADGGVRTMLIAGLGPPGADEAADAPPASAGTPGASGEGNFSLGVTSGAAKPDLALPTHTLIIQLSDEDGKPMANRPVVLGGVDQTNQLKIRKATSDATGEAKFTDLPTGQKFGYAAVVEHRGMRLSTEPFVMPDQGGMRATVRALARTSDPAAVTIGQGARVILQMRNDNLQFMEILPLENRSEKLFDPGVGAVEIPLPKGFVGAEVAPSDRKLEIRKDHGIAVYGAITPRQALGQMDAKTAGNEVTLGFVLPYEGDSREFHQPLPNGIGPFTLITEQIEGLTVSGPGLGARESRELGGRKYWVMPAEPIGAGQTLNFTISGLPSTDHTGRAVSGIMALSLIVSAFVFGRRPGNVVKKTVDERQRLTDRREELFTELVTLEQNRRAAGERGGADRHNQLVGKLETIYQDLAALDEQRAL